MKAPRRSLAEAVVQGCLWCHQALKSRSSEGLKKEQVEFSQKLSVSPLVQQDYQIDAEQV